MSWLNNFLSEDDQNDKSLQDKEIALDLLLGSKNDIAMLSKAAAEAASPKLRQILTNQLNSCINDHFKLADIAIQKGWYNAYASPGQQIKQDMQEAQQILQKQN